MCIRREMEEKKIVPTSHLRGFMAPCTGSSATRPKEFYGDFYGEIAVEHNHTAGRLLRLVRRLNGSSGGGGGRSVVDETKRRLASKGGSYRVVPIEKQWKSHRQERACTVDREV
jgi:hypothetical protein